MDRAFPVLYANGVERSALFYEKFGFQRHVQLPEDEPGYIGLKRGASELAIVSADWPRDHYELAMGDGPRFEMFLYISDVDATVETLRGSGTTILKEPQDMPWGERIAYVTDPDGNPVALANTSSSPKT
jgi:lactoylglutathione lyase